jgi:HAD superfamily hydrolase (TIGR01458 family)
MTADFSGIKGILFDLDGVLYVGDTVIEGAIQTLSIFAEKNLPMRFITNTSTRTAEDVANKLKALGFNIGGDQIFSAVSATRDYLRAKGKPSVHLLIREAAREEFADFPQDVSNPEYVVVGDIGAAWDYPLLNRVFNELMQGAELIAMHKNRFWQTEQGLQMDIGAFVAGLEYVSGKEAVIIGKPSPAFFRLAVQSLHLAPAEVVIVGDDIENDVGGGQNSELKGVLVRTGKYREEVAEASDVRPDAIIDSIADLPELLKS